MGRDAVSDAAVRDGEQVRARHAAMRVGGARAAIAGRTGVGAAARRVVARAAVVASVVARASVVAGALALGACGGADWRVKQLYGGPTSIDVLTHPQSVEAFRLDPVNPPRTPDTPRLGDFAVTAGPVAVDAAAVAELSSVLLDAGTYDWFRAKGCEFTPGVGLRFVKDASRVEIVLCFSCDELMIFRHGRRIGMEDFDAARPRLLAVAKRLFPEDAGLAALR